jgi:hypothetical protein
MRTVVVAALSCAVSLNACSGTPSSETAISSQRSTPNADNTSRLPQPADTAAPNGSGVPDRFRQLWKQAVSDGPTGEHAGINYRYAVSGDRAAAVMIPRPIPRNDTLLVGTISDLARRAFRADLSAATPRLEPTDLGGNAIAFTVGRQAYFVLIIKNETQEGAYGPGEPHTLLIWREAR